MSDKAGGVMKNKNHQAVKKLNKRKAEEPSPFVTEMFTAALQHHQAGDLREAEAFYRQVLAADPHHADSLHLLGVLAHQVGQHDQAVDLINQAIKINDRAALYHSNLGNALKALGKLEPALTSYRKAISVNPRYPEAYNNMGTAWQDQKQLDKAIVCFQNAIDLKPDFAEAYNNKGNALIEAGQRDEAILCYNKAVDLNPRVAETHYNLGVVLADQGLLDEAVICYRQALELKPNAAETHNNLAMALLARGDLTEGWQEYEWRWQTTRMQNFRRSFPQPQWRGEVAPKRTLLIHAEQGLGDTLQFCRYAPLAAAAGFRVLMEVQKPLVRLLRHMPGIERVIAQGENLPAFDLHCPMLSLPLALGTTLATIPSTSSYLVADAKQTVSWQARLATLGFQGPKIGIAWAGNSATASDQRRSLDPGQLAPLLDIPGLHFFSLQKDGTSWRTSPDPTDFMNEMDDFADTAAFISNLDLVISVDTAVAHLAAGLGKPVWLLDRFDSDWRWLMGRRDSPWYPTLRIYRQPQPGDWHSVLTEVVHDLHTTSNIK